MSKYTLPFVSIIIPCRNEEIFIGRCLDSLINQDYPKEKIELLIMDGMSTDRTRIIVQGYTVKNSFIRLIDNPEKFQSFALNKGIKESTGEIIIRCDAHAEYNRNHIKRSVYWLQKDNSIGNVGGMWINKPGNNSLKAKGIAYSLEHWFCVGPNKYRLGVTKPREVDTVPFGAWRREIFDKVGLFNENFLRAQDLELNMRIKKTGYKIFLDPEIKICYYPRDNFKKLFSMMVQYGYWKILVNKKLKVLSSIRQLAPPLFVLYLFLIPILAFASFGFMIPLIVYLLLSSLFSFRIAAKKKNAKLVSFIFLTFLVSHIGYGLGYIKGVKNILILRHSDSGEKHIEITR
jgi:glycosyltransferase involved in cell wall biosynthesis